MSRQINIAIVDDDEQVRTALSRLISAFGFIATAYESAEAFIADPETRRFSCVLSDYQMPGKSGLDLVDHLRANSIQASVLVITARDHRAIEEKCKRLQVALLKKPLEASALRKAIQDALSSPAASADAIRGSLI